MQVVFKFKPFSKKQLKVLTWWMPNSPVHDMNGVIADGAIRSGKTLSMSLSFVIWAMECFSAQNFAMCGKTIGSFRRNVLFWLKLMLRSRGYGVADHRADNLMVVTRKGVENYFYIFGGKDERSQDLIQGITLAGLFCDEIALMPESFVNQATGRCSVEGSKFWFNCNPDGPFHWFKVNWIDKAAEKHLLYLHFTMDDNLSLSEKIKARYRSLYTGVFYKRYIQGLWVIAEGLVYEFDDAKNATNEAPEDGEWYVSIDYGTQNPCSMGLWNVGGTKAIRVNEFYYSGRDERSQKTDDEYYTELEKLAGSRKITCVVIDPSAASFIATIRKHGRFSIRNAKNDVLDGIRVTAAMLKNGNILINRRCKNAIMEFGQYSWDDKATEDKVIKDHDHAMDDIRYFCNTIMRRKLRWEGYSGDK